MNNCPSYVDHNYYGKKYGLYFKDKNGATEHYIKVGKEEGYFPNYETEIFFNKSINFDEKYYSKKYNIRENAKQHWINFGQKNNYYVNLCDENKTHHNCNCVDVNIIDYNIKKEMIDITDMTITDTCCKRSSTELHDDDSISCSCSACLNDELNISRIDKKKNTFVSETSIDHTINTSNNINMEDGNTIYEYNKQIESSHDHQEDSSDCKCSECAMPKKKLFTKNKINLNDNSSINNNFEEDEISYCDCQDSTCNVKKHNDNNSTIDNSLNKTIDNSLNKTKDNSNKYLQIEKNITNIRNYLSSCNIYLETYLKLMKNAYQCISDICNPDSNYLVYNTARVKLQTIMIEIDKFVSTSYHNKTIPLFYLPGKKAPTFIKFPFITSDITELPGDKYFKIHFMKLSLKHLKLESYKYTLLEQGDILTDKTSSIPPSNCPVGQTPSRNMYSTDELIKCWNINYHMSNLENALGRIIIEKEMIDNCINLLDIKCDLIEKLKNTNK